MLLSAQQRKTLLKVFLIQLDSAADYSAEVMEAYLMTAAVKETALHRAARGRANDEIKVILSEKCKGCTSFYGC